MKNIAYEKPLVPRGTWVLTLLGRVQPHAREESVSIRMSCLVDNSGLQGRPQRIGCPQDAVQLKRKRHGPRHIMARAIGVWRIR